jgi:hypothetical protein
VTVDNKKTQLLLIAFSIVTKRTSLAWYCTLYCQYFDGKFDPWIFDFAREMQIQMTCQLGTCNFG